MACCVGVAEWPSTEVAGEFAIFLSIGKADNFKSVKSSRLQIAA